MRVLIVTLLLHTSLTGFTQSIPIFRAKADSLKRIVRDERFNSRKEKVINTTEDLDTTSASYKVKSLNLNNPNENFAVETYREVERINNSLMDDLIKSEIPTQYERDVSSKTRKLIAIVEQGYLLALVRRQILELPDTLIGDWLRNKLKLAISEEMVLYAQKNYPVYSYPSDRRQAAKFISIRTGNDLFTVAGLSSLFMPADKYIKDGNLFFQRNDDRDYTGSFLLEVGTDYLNLLKRKPVNSYQTFLYGFDVYTPYFRDSTMFPNPDSYNQSDRPHASFQYFGWTRNSISRLDNIRWTLGLKVGKIGGAAGAKFQTVLHQDISYSPRPRGWDAQIANGGRLGISFEYKRERQWHLNRNANIASNSISNVYASTLVEGKLGTYMTYGAAGISLSNKPFKQNNPNFIGTYSREARHKLFWQHLMYRVSFVSYAMVHNTMLEGYGIIKTTEDKNDAITPKSSYVLRGDQVRPYFYMLNITLSYSTRYTTFFYNWKSISPETYLGDIGIPSPASGIRMDISNRWHHFAELGMAFRLLK
jgi:hypothetical protein